jgi:hypothetical protein
MRHDLDSGLNIYLEVCDETKGVALTIQGKANKFRVNEADGSVYLRGDINVSDLDEISKLFRIAMECNC